MLTLNDVRGALADAENLMGVLDCCTGELRHYAERLIRQANAMEYSDVAYPESVLLAALILRLRRRLASLENPTSED